MAAASGPEDVVDLEKVATNGLPYTFGGNIEASPASGYGTGAMSSPLTSKAPQNGVFYADNSAWNGGQLQDASAAVFPPVTFGEQQQFQSGSLPSQTVPSLHHSPSSATNGRASSSSQNSSPESVPPRNGSASKKRKSLADDDPVDRKGKQPPVKKTAHNMIEKRYRTNLNDKIAALRDSVPSLRVMSRVNGVEEEDDPEDLEGLMPAHKLNKATVLSKATEYIRHLEKRNKRLCDDVAALKARVDQLEKLPMATPLVMTNSAATPDSVRYQEDPFATTPVPGSSLTHNGPQGMIPVPESISNLHHAMSNQPHYASAQAGYPVYTTAPGRPGVPAHQQQHVNAREGGRWGNKLMVGSLAGLMVMEGFSSREQSGEQPNGRGLFAFPFDLFRRFGGSFAPRLLNRGLATLYALLPYLKTLLVLGALLYLISPLFEFKPRSKKKSAPHVRLSPAPSLASPVTVRRKAWLTAIQTVWVPQHTFLLEIAALGLKTLKLSTRKLVGWHGYALLTGITKEQEAARVKAWEIALDAQLTGGDVEISMSRLVLTLMASGTLPDTPARLLLKALHIRITLWEVARAGYGTWYMFAETSAKLARNYWNAARAEHKMTINCPSSENSIVEPLPDHLATLLELECDDVLIDRIVQRAYNLAWNRPSATNTVPDEAMDSVVEDFAISSPLDALAAWWSSHSLSRALVRHLSSGKATPDRETLEDLELAIQTAPPTSGAHARALVAKAVLLPANRQQNIIAAFETFPSQSRSSAASNRSSGSPPAALMNLVGETPIAPDVMVALTLAKCLCLAEQSEALGAEAVRQGATFVINSFHLPEMSITLLSFTAAYMVVDSFAADQALRSEAKDGLERITGSLRVWVGRAAGRRSGLPNKAKAMIVERCLQVSKMLVGLQEAVEEGDAGYVSGSDDDDAVIKRG
ncbi:Clr6 histone deacetylase associated PHD protein-2 Cph2 [Coniosporium apollinis]|uniref:Clr6 histone deacetylase associated PHD protein-2 Cph2 n=2 Tax=Coniosporium TaxID=2810619 RepID=A0ABQ9NQ44_9PEZI|nr:Clr6 histone deacetylase associated PHD protein-2 Cph2 [Coniosporium apollinis]